jgi:hypothetical protein
MLRGLLPGLAGGHPAQGPAPARTTRPAPRGRGARGRSCRRRGRCASGGGRGARVEGCRRTGRRGGGWRRLRVASVPAQSKGLERGGARGRPASRAGAGSRCTAWPRACRLGLPVVAPLHDRRHAHQDALGAAAAVQAEVRAAVPHEVELDVAAAPVGLEVALALAVGRGAAALHDGQVGGQEGVAHGAHQREAALEAAVGEVVEEDAADAARLVARCLRKKYSSHQGLKRGYSRCRSGASASAAGAVEVLRVFLEAVVGREVHAAAEPHHGAPCPFRKARRACARSCAPWARRGCAGA